MFRIQSGDIIGIDGRVVEIEVDLIHELKNFVISGLPGPGIREARDRIQSAIVNCNYKFPRESRIVVNLAPASSEKDGAAFDLPIALGILASFEQIEFEGDGWGCIGELALDGRVRPVPGTIGIVASLLDRGVKRILVPIDSLGEARAVAGDRVEGVGSLSRAVKVVTGQASGEPLQPTSNRGGDREGGRPRGPDFHDVLGQRSVKRALAIAAAGHHNVLLVGPPGAGKSFLARRLPSLLPPLETREALEVTRVLSAAGLHHGQGLATDRPYRAPHHTVSWA